MRKGVCPVVIILSSHWLFSTGLSQARNIFLQAAGTLVSYNLMMKWLKKRKEITDHRFVLVDFSFSHFACFAYRHLKEQSGRDVRCRMAALTIASNPSREIFKQKLLKQLRIIFCVCATVVDCTHIILMFAFLGIRSLRAENRTVSGRHVLRLAKTIYRKMTSRLGEAAWPVHHRWGIWKPSWSWLRTFLAAADWRLCTVRVFCHSHPSCSRCWDAHAQATSPNKQQSVLGGRRLPCNGLVAPSASVPLGDRSFDFSLSCCSHTRGIRACSALLSGCSPIRVVTSRCFQMLVISP